MASTPGNATYCPACTPNAVRLDDDQKLSWMALFAFYEHAAPGYHRYEEPDCPYVGFQGMSLAAERFCHLASHWLRGKQSCPPMPGDPQPEFWPSYRPKREFTGDSLIQRIKAAYRLEDIAGRLTRLYGTGNVLSGRCPLHGEKSGRAFTVWVDTQRWKCFGKCLAGGDVIDLVRECKARGIAWNG